MKKGKKSKLTLGVILMLVLMFVGTTVVAAAGGSVTFTWSPESPIAGDDQHRPVIRPDGPDGPVSRGVEFSIPDDLEFQFEPEYNRHVTAEDGSQTLEPTSTVFAYTKAQLDAMWAADAEAQGAYDWTIYFSPTKTPYEPVATVSPAGVFYGFPMPTQAHVILQASYDWLLPEVTAGVTPSPVRTEARSKAIETTIPIGKGQPVVWGETKKKTADKTDRTFVPMNEFVISAGDTAAFSPYARYDQSSGIDAPYEDMGAGAFVCTYYTMARQSDIYLTDGGVSTVTVYVKDADGNRVDLGSKMFQVNSLNLYSGWIESAFQLFKLNVVEWNEPCDPPTMADQVPALKGDPNLSKLKPGAYTLLADLDGNDYNEASTGNKIGSITVTGISEVTVDPASLSVENGETQQQKFTANVKAVETEQEKISDKTVTWSISGQKSADTKIDPQTGVLTVGADEPAGTITVTAESVFDNYGQGKARGEAKVTVTESDHSVINGTSEVQPGQDGRWEFAGKFANLKALRLNGVDFTIVPESAAKSQLKYPGYSGVAGIAEEGSVKVTLYKEFLATLPAGEYKLEAFFNDGGVQNIGSTQFTLIREEAQPTATATAAPEKKAPKTGDETGVWLWIVLAAAAAGIAWFAYRNKKAKASE